MNYLKLVIKTTCIVRHLSDHAVSPPRVNVFRQPAVGSWKLTETHLLFFLHVHQQFTNHPEVFAANTIQVKNSRVLFLLNRLNF
jgi:hypothetical protein